MRNSVHAEQTSSPYPLFTAAAGLPGFSVGHHHANLSLCPELQPKLLKCMFIKKNLSLCEAFRCSNKLHESITNKPPLFHLTKHGINVRGQYVTYN